MSTLDPAVYRRAADVIRKGGLVKRAYADQGGHCTVGALRVATGQRWLDQHSPEAEFLADLLGLGPAPCVCGCDAIEHPSVALWNDREETTEADVIGLLTQAAEKLEASEVIVP